MDLIEVVCSKVQTPTSPIRANEYLSLKNNENCFFLEQLGDCRFIITNSVPYIRPLASNAMFPY